MLMMNLIRCRCVSASRPCKCMSYFEKKRNGVSFIWCMGWYFYCWVGTSWQYHSIMLYVRVLDSRWHNMLRTINSKMKRFRFIESFGLSSWVTHTMTFLGNSLHRLLQWLSMQVRLLWVFIRYSIGLIGLLRGLQCINCSLKMRPFTSIKYNVSALKINCFTQMNHSIFLCSSIWILQLITTQTLEIAKKYFSRTISSHLLTKQSLKFSN